MAAESNVGARLLLIGKDAALTGVREMTAAYASLNAEIARGAGASKVAAAGYEEQSASLTALQAKMDLYQTNLVAVGAETDAVARLGKVGFLALGAAAATWTYESVKWAQSYQTALTQLRTQAGLTVTAMNAVGKAAMANAATVGMSPTQYLQAAYHPASTGMSTKETIAITNYAGMESVISGSSAEDTTNSLTGVMKSYKLGTNKAESTIAQLNAIVGAGNMHFSDLNSALASGVANTAKTFGVSLTSMGGALAYLTDRTIPAARAGTSLRMSLALMGAPSKIASTLLQDAGMTDTAAKDSTNAMSQLLYQAGVQPTQMSQALADNSGAGGIYNALELLHKNLTGSGLSKTMQDAMLSRAFGGGKSGSTIEALYNNLGGLKAKSAQITSGSTDKKYMEDWLTATKTLDYQLGKLGHTVETMGTQFGTDLLPPLTKVVGMFTDFLKFMDKNKGVAIALGGAVMAVLVPAIGVYLKRALLSANGGIMTVVRGYARMAGMQTEEQAALARTGAALASTTGATERLATADVGLGGASESLAGKLAVEDAAAGAAVPGSLGLNRAVNPYGASTVGTAEGVAGTEAGSAGFLSLAKGAAGKAGMGALVASIAMPVLNGFFQKPLEHAIGKTGEAVLGDAAAGAMTGALLGPLGILGGAAAGALIGDRGHIERQLNVAGHGLAVAGRDTRHQTAHAFDDTRHTIAGTADDIWHGLFGGGSTKPPKKVAPPVIHVDNHVYIDGKEVTKVTTKRVKASIARQ